jgi:hypothetical protein
MVPDLEKGELATGKIEEVEGDGHGNRNHDGSSDIGSRPSRSGSGAGRRDSDLNSHSNRTHAETNDTGSRSSRSGSGRGSRGVSSVRSRDPPPRHIDPENPGSWVLRHHKDNLISELREPESSFISKIYDQYFKHMTKTSSGTTSKEPHDDHKTVKSTKWEARRFRVSFAELQRMHLRKLQIKLAKHVVDMHYSNRESEGWEETLRQYSKYYPLSYIIRIITATI